MASAMSGDEIQAKIEEVRPTISPLLEEAGKFDSRIVAVKSEIMHVLESKGLAYRVVVHSSFVGVHPENRYGDGIVPFNVHSLISDIFAHGFSFDACSDATASEVPPHDCPTREWFQQFNDELMTGAAGMLPAYKDTIKIVSLTCGHCSQGLRAIHEGVQSDQEEVSDNGCLSLEKIALRDRKYAKACKEGIPWKVIRWQVEKAFPDLAHVVSEAGNAGQQIAKPETRTQIMFKIHQFAKRQHAHNNDVDWASVARHASRARPPFKSEINDLCTVVAKLSGGIERPVLLEEYNEFLHQLKTERVVRGSFMAAAATANLGHADAPLFKWAMFKAMASASEKYASGVDATLLRTADVHSIASKHKQYVLQAEAVLQECRKLFASAGAPLTLRPTLLGLLDVRMVHHIFQKPDPKRGSFKSIACIGHQFVQDLSSALDKTLSSPWGSHLVGPADASALASPSKELPIASFTSSGAVVDPINLVRSKGFVVGSRVVRIADKEVGIICTMTDNDVGVQFNANEVLDIAHMEFLNDFELEVTKDCFDV